MAGTDNGKYVDRGRGLVAAYDPGRGDDLRDANRRRNGAPFLHADGGYASRANVAECARPSVTPDIRLPASRTARGRGSGDAWGLLLRRQQGAGRGRPSAACPGTSA